jgi:hypothetical protein
MNVGFDGATLVVRASLSFTVTLRKEGQVELRGKTPNGLSASATLAAASDKQCQYYFCELPPPILLKPTFLGHSLDEHFITIPRKDLRIAPGRCIASRRSNPPRIRKSPLPVQQTQSAFRRHAPRNAFRSHARQQSKSFGPQDPELRPSPNSNSLS